MAYLTTYLAIHSGQGVDKKNQNKVVFFLSKLYNLMNHKITDKMC